MNSVIGVLLVVVGVLGLLLLPAIGYWQIRRGLERLKNQVDLPVISRFGVVSGTILLFWGLFLIALLLYEVIKAALR